LKQNEELIAKNKEYAAHIVACGAAVTATNNLYKKWLDIKRADWPNKDKIYVIKEAFASFEQELNPEKEEV